MLNTLNKPWLTAATFLAFVLIANYSRHDYNRGYSAKDNAFVESIIVGAMTNNEKLNYLWSE